MKRIFTSCLLLFIFQLISASMFPVAYGSKYGYVDESLKKCSDPIYDSATEFVDGIAVVKKNNIFYIINEQFIEIAEINAKYAGKPAYNHIWFSKDGNFYYTDYSGNIVISGFDKASNFSDGYAIVEKNGIKQILDSEHNLIPISQYSNIYLGFNNGLLVVSNQAKKTGAINGKGEEIIDFKYDGNDMFSEEISCFCKNIGKKRLYGYVNVAGIEIIPSEYYSGYRFYNGVTCVEKQTEEGNSVWIVINKNNEVMYTFDDNISIFSYYSNNLCVFTTQTSNRYGIITTKGNIVYEQNLSINSIENISVTGTCIQLIINGENILIDETGYIYLVRDIFNMTDIIPAKAYG